MQPTQLALVIHKGATFRARLRVMQPTPEYRDITAIIAAAPVQLTVDHGLPTDWPIWVERVRQLTALNRAPIQQQPHFARIVDAETLEISTINAAGTNGAGGQIVYYPPLPLTGATAELTLYEKGVAVGTLPVTVDAGGWVDVVLTDEQTEALEWSALEYTLDVQLGSTDVLRVYAGKATAIAAGTAPATCQGFAVIGADRGPPGPTVSTAQFDTQGRLVITLEDGTELISNPLNRPWGTIAGDITSQQDLMDLFGEKVDGDDYLQFVQQVTNALNDRYTKGEVDTAIATRTTPAEAAAAAPVQSVQGRTGNVTITKPDLNIENVNNTSDADKPVSTAQQTALDAKVSISAIVDNLTSIDTQKPLSANQGRVLKGLVDNIETLLNSDNINLDTLQEIVDFIEMNRATLDTLGISNIAGLQQALDLKADQNGDYANLRARSTTAADVGLGLANNTPDSQKPVSTPQQEALDLKVDKVAGKQLSAESFETEEKNKLGGIAAGATANSSDTFLRDRANHTGTQAATTVTIADAGNYFTGTNTETVLQEVGALIGDTSAALDAINGEAV